MRTESSCFRRAATMTTADIRKYLPKALRLARDNANLSYACAARKARVSRPALEKHETGTNLPTVDNFLDELEAYGLDFMSFHELLIEVRIREKVGWKEEDRDINGQIITLKGCSRDR